MRWQRVARLVVAAIGIGCAVAIYLLTRERPVPAAGPTIADVDPNAALQSGRGVSYLHRDGRLRVEVRYERVKAFDDARQVFEEAHIKGLDGQKFELWAAKLEAKGAPSAGELPAHLEATGVVKLVTDDGLMLETDKALYDGATGRVTMPNAVTFARGRLSGRGMGATYEREQETIQFLDQAAVRVAPDAEGKGAADATAKSMTLVRGQKSLRMDENARIVSETDVLAGDTATLYFTEDESALKYLELRGHASVTPVPGAPAGAPALSAGSITLTFHPDGRTLQHATLTGQAVVTLRDGGTAKSIRASWIDMYTAADGRTLTRLDARDRVVVTLPPAKDAPGRTITSTTLTATGTEADGLTLAIFDGSPRFEEKPAPARGAQAPPAGIVGTAQRIALTLDGGLESIETAEFRQSARFVDGKVTATGDLAVYDEARQTLLLRANEKPPRRLSRVEDPEITVDGVTIDLSIEQHDLKARGEVSTTMAGRTGPDRAKSGRAGGSPALFKDTEPIYGASDEMDYTRAAGRAVYTGLPQSPARVWQGRSRILADRIVVEDATSNLAAEGRVDTLFETAVEAGGAGRTTPPETRVLADTFSYDDATRTARYQGSTVTMTSTDGETEGRELTMVLASESRTVERMLVNGAAYTKMSDGLEAAGDSLAYSAATGIYTLRGQPAQVKSAPSKDSTCLLSRARVLELNRSTGSVSTPVEAQGAPTQSEYVPCTLSLRSGR